MVETKAVEKAESSVAQTVASKAVNWDASMVASMEVKRAD